MNARWLAILRVVRSMGTAALLFVAVLRLIYSSYDFILLPVFLSFFLSDAAGNPLDIFYGFSIFFNSTPLYLLLTFCLSLLYCSLISALILLTHRGEAATPIILVSVTLAWAIILEPARAYVQGLIRRRFNVRNREMMKALEAFTSSLREEIDLDQLRERFLDFLQQTMRPYSVSLWIRMVAQQHEQSPVEDTMVTVAADDPLLAYIRSHPGLLEIDRLSLDSPTLQEAKASTAEILLSLATQGELVGVLLVGPHLNGEEYTYEERTTLDTLARQVAPALRVGQLVQEQQAEVRKRERIEQELRTAQLIQRTFLPKDIPAFPGWQLVPYYQPAREVGGDFYDFLPFADGRLGLVIGDVTGKGIPAALVMTATRTMVRTAAQEETSPGEVLRRVNDLLAADIPAGMFVTCFYAVLDTTSGRLCYANAGHEPPYRRSEGTVSTLWATGMPLGMLPGTLYDEHEVNVGPGESLLFYSDGLVEAHNAEHEMFSFPRLKTLLEVHADGEALIHILLKELKNFTGPAWEQEDDVTLVELQRTTGPHGT